MNENIETHFDMLNADETEGEEVANKSYQPGCGRNILLRGGKAV